MKQIISGILLSMFFIACSKKEVVRPGAASLVIFHGVAGGNLFKTSYAATPPAFFYTANTLVYGSFYPGTNLYGAVAGELPLAIYNVPDTMPKSEPLFKLQLNLPEGSMHSLFLTGTPAAPESVLVKDEPLPLPAGDSAMGIRFVNLLTNNIPVSINIALRGEGSEVVNLPYKSVTDFKKYAVKMNVTDYVFEFRNANTGTVIASYTTAGIANNGKLAPNAWVYKNFAFALIGKLGETGSLAPKIVKINYARVN